MKSIKKLIEFEIFRFNKTDNLGNFTERKMMIIHYYIIIYLILHTIINH